MSYFDIPTRVRLAAGLPPLLLVHDRDDKEVDTPDTEDLAAAWPGSTVVRTTGLGHRRILRDPAVVARVLDFLTRTQVR